jgi:hypothetical protein
VVKNSWPAFFPERNVLRSDVDLECGRVILLHRG